MLNHEVIELLRTINQGGDPAFLLKHHGIAADSLPPKRRRRVLNRLTWAAASFASAVARARAEIAAIAVDDDDEMMKMDED